MRLLILTTVLVLAHSEPLPEDSSTVVDLFNQVYERCLQDGSFSCVKPKVLSFLSSAMKKEKILLTEDLAIVRTARFSNHVDDQKFVVSDLPNDSDERQKTIRFLMLDKIDDFLSSHELKMRFPKELMPLVPSFLVDNIPPEVSLPLSESRGMSQERGFVKKVLIPFLLGLKFKATALIPLAIALIALKTWKALTLGLLSIVLSGAMVIFRFTKPKVVNYEVYHYPSHPPAPPAMDHGMAQYGDHHGYGRSDVDAQTLAYKAQRR